MTRKPTHPLPLCQFHNFGMGSFFHFFMKPFRKVSERYIFSNISHSKYQMCAHSSDIFVFSRVAEFCGCIRYILRVRVKNWLYSHLEGGVREFVSHCCTLLQVLRNQCLGLYTGFIEHYFIILLLPSSS